MKFFSISSAALAVVSIRAVPSWALAVPSAPHNSVINRQSAGAESCLIDEEWGPGSTKLKDLWVVNKLSVHYTGDETVRRGNASFTLSHTDPDILFTEDITCSLRANYVCEVYGTTKDPNLNIWLQLNLNVGTFTFNRTLSNCFGEGKNAYILGTAEMYLECPQQYIDEEEGMLCADDGIAGPADGHVVSPESSETNHQEPKKREEPVDKTASPLEERGPAKAEEDVAAPKPVGRQTERRKTMPVEPVHYEEV